MDKTSETIVEDKAGNMQEPELKDKNVETKKDSPLRPEETPVVEKEHRTFPESTSQTVGKLALAMSNAQGAMTNGTKDAQGYGYKYMTLANLTDIAREHLAANDIAILQSHELIKGTMPSVVTHTTVMHGSGEWHKSSIELPIKSMPQLTPAQMVGVNATYGRRYALQALCLIAAEEDTDGSAKK